MPDLYKSEPNMDVLPLENPPQEATLDRYRSRLWPYAYNIPGDTMEAEDVVSAICQINAWNRIAITFGNVPGSYEAP